jgi:hypothetical protein
LKPPFSKAVISFEAIHTFKSSRLYGAILTHGLKFLDEKRTLTKDMYMCAKGELFNGRIKDLGKNQRKGLQYNLFLITELYCITYVKMCD